jgi:hypothetical protein
VRLPKKVQEKLLHKVLGFRGVMENSLADAVDQLSIPPEQEAQGLLIICAHPGKEPLVGRLVDRRKRVLRDGIRGRSVFAKLKRRIAGCRK